MLWFPDVSWFWGGVFLVNALPHPLRRMPGRACQRPCARPPGVGLSFLPATAGWGAFNLLVSYLLGALPVAPCVGRDFGRFYGGHAPVALPLLPVGL